MVPVQYRVDALKPFTLSFVLLSLYLSQGLPSGFLAHTLPAVLRDSGVDHVYIGMLKLLALPWFLKVLWAPFVDQKGGRKYWILTMQLACATALLVIACFPQVEWMNHLVLFFLVLLLINTCAATQDIATDGLAARLLPRKWLGIGNSLQVGGYKLGMIISGSGFLILLDQFGWSFSFMVLGVSLVVLSLPAMLLLKTHRLGGKNKDANEQAGVDKLHWWAVFRDALVQPHWRAWLPVLIFYKVADSLGSAMIKPLLVDVGWSKSAIGELTLVASLCGLLAALFAGLIYYRLGAKVTLVGFGVLQALGIGAFGFLSNMELSVAQIYGIAVFEQMADGCSTVALFALMMSYCRPGSEGSDFTLQASLQVIVAGTLGMLSGFVVKYCGYDYLYGASLCLGLLASGQAWLFFRHSRPESHLVS